MEAATHATKTRRGLLRQADGGVLFLDEVGELGLDEQAMLLRAVEEKRFLPLGSDREVSSDFQLIAGTNRDLPQQVRSGTFREDLLARIDLWTFRLPSLRDRPEDLEPNLEYELDGYARRTGARVTFNREARERFLRFATSPEAVWSRNFRDLGAPSPGCAPTRGADASRRRSWRRRSPGCGRLGVAIEAIRRGKGSRSCWGTKPWTGWTSSTGSSWRASCV